MCICTIATKKNTLKTIMEQHIELLNTRINTCKKNIKDLENVTL